MLRKSLPSRERGLKYTERQAHLDGRKSLPSRERGLKFESFKRSMAPVQVAPFTGAWIEIQKRQAGERHLLQVAPFTGAWIEIRWICSTLSNWPSLPSRERGLKYVRPERDGQTAQGRYLHGSVD